MVKAKILIISLMTLILFSGCLNNEENNFWKYKEVKNYNIENNLSIIQKAHILCNYFNKTHIINVHNKGQLFVCFNLNESYQINLNIKEIEFFGVNNLSLWDYKLKESN